MELEGKGSSGKEVPLLIEEQQWWKDRQRSSKDKEIETKKGVTKESKRVSPTKLMTDKQRGEYLSMHVVFVSLPSSKFLKLLYKVRLFDKL